MEGVMSHASDLNLKATELRLGLPGTDEHDEFVSVAKNNKRALPDQSATDSGRKGISSGKSIDHEHEHEPAPKAQIVGWPPVRSYRKNNLQAKKTEAETGMYVKVSMDGAPYLRKIDLSVYNGYAELLKALESMFKLTIGDYSEREGYKGSEYAPAYEDKDGDLMLVGDVPWDMFMSSCKRLRIMKGSDASGLGCGV
ncbi:Auxin-induced protein 22D [Sesamum alatum]|uniref:Auxin-responsive protein n=1 Tax=Sesamum alatum TaxID=300844 RepID=A0AAE1YQE8_9LAMI|nr:Auxin-induced protein 22D [Sesamum alatum]